MTTHERRRKSVAKPVRSFYYGGYIPAYLHVILLRITQEEPDTTYDTALCRCLAAGTELWLNKQERPAREAVALTRPIVRYHGGKWRIAPWILQNLPAHRIYVEPYGGGASVLLRKSRSYAEIYNDLSSEMVNVLSVLRSPARAGELIHLLHLTPYAREEFELTYDETDDLIERARRTIIRSFMGFSSAATNKNYNTGFRANGNRSYTVPAHDWTNYAACVPAFIERLRGVVIEHRPAIEVIKQQDREDALYYIDPPYVRSTRRRGRDCYEFEMTDDEHRELAEVLHHVKGMVVLSGYHSALYDELYGDWQRVERPTVADSGGHGAGERTEVLWINPAAARQQQMQIGEATE